MALSRDGALGDEQQVLLAHLVVAQARAGDEAGPGHARLPHGLRVAVLDGVELDPQHLGLEAQRRDGGVLLLGRAAALDGEVERVLRVARRLHEPGAEVLEPGGVDPPVVALERVEPHADRVGPEELGER